MLNIVIIGDSIAKGVGSTDEKTGSFGAIVGEKLDAKVTNLGITGLDSGQLIEKLQTEKFVNAIEDADVILMSIGSNDLLKPFLSTVAESAGIKGDSKTLYEELQKEMATVAKENPLKAGSILANAVKNVQSSKELDEACVQFPQQLDTIVGRLKELNPDAILYVNNIYNPYYGVVYKYQGLTLLNIQDICEGYISRLNEAFDGKSEEYTVVDMYSVFRQTGYTHVNPGTLEDMSKLNFDPHPNDQGYQVMGDYIYTHMDSVAPKAIVTADANELPVDYQGFTVTFSEKVRCVKGKSLNLTDGVETVAYILTGQETVLSNEDGTFTLELPMSLWTGRENLKYDTSYTITMEDGAFKDKGNNSPKELTLVEFHTEEDPEADISANSTAIVQRGNNSPIGSSILIGGGIFVAFAVAITVAVLYNKKRL